MINEIRKKSRRATEACLLSLRVGGDPTAQMPYGIGIALLIVASMPALCVDTVNERLCLSP